MSFAELCSEGFVAYVILQILNVLLWGCIRAKHGVSAMLPKSGTKIQQKFDIRKYFG